MASINRAAKERTARQRQQRQGVPNHRIGAPIDGSGFGDLDSEDPTQQIVWSRSPAGEPFSDDDALAQARAPSSDDDAGSLPMNDPKKLLDGKHCADRVFVVEIKGSPEIFAANPKLARAKVATEFSAKYRPFGTDTGAIRAGDITNAVLFHSHIIWVDNTFAFPVMLQSKGIRGRWYAGEQRGFFAAPVGRMYDPNGFMVHHPTRSLSSKTVVDYRHYGKDAHKEGVVHAEEWSLVKPGTATADILFRNQTVIKPNYSMTDFESRKNDGSVTYMVPTALVRSAQKCYVEKVMPARPNINLNKLNIRIARLSGAPWKASFNTVFSGDRKESTDARMLSMAGSVTIALRIKYRVPMTKST